MLHGRLNPLVPERQLRLADAVATCKLSAHKVAKIVRLDVREAHLLGITLHQAPGAGAAHGLDRGATRQTPAVK